MGTFTGFMGAIAKYFEYNRTIASEIVFAGGSIGMIVIPFLFQACLEAFTLRGVLLIYAGFILNFMVVGLVVRMIERRPCMVIQIDNIKGECESHELRSAKNEQKIQDGSQTETDTAFQVERHRQSTGIEEDQNVTKFQTCTRPFFSIQFITISLYYFCYIYGVYGYLFYIPPYLLELGISKSQVTSAMSINGVLDFISRLGIGFLARIPRVNIYILIAVNTALTGCFDVLVPLMLTSGSAYAVMVGNLAFVGLFAGGLMGLINQLIVDAVGMEKAGTGAGIFVAIFGISVIVYSQVYGRFIFSKYLKVNCYPAVKFAIKLQND